MRASLSLACGAAAIGAALAVACADSGGDENGVVPDSGPPPTIVPEAGVDPGDAGADAADSGPRCSTAGWCETKLPDADLRLLDIWPLEGRAFAIATSANLGVKVLEWTDEGSTWEYIDDVTQNEPGLGAYAGKIWAPSADEVYFGVGAGWIYHGTRPTSPGAAWVWTRSSLPYTGRRIPEDGFGRYPMLGVWGTSATDVYAWYNNAVYHWGSVDGGSPGWDREYVVDDLDGEDEAPFFLAAAGTDSGDVWFSGARSRFFRECALVVRKTSAGYIRIADSTVDEFAGCTERAGTVLLGGADGRLAHLQSTGAGQVIGLKGKRDLMRLSAVGNDFVSDIAPPVPDWINFAEGDELQSMWSISGTLWLSVAGMVLRGTDAWTADKSSWAISTLALNGTPIGRSIFQVRGTSNTNLWAIGEQHARHKTTP